MLKRLANEPVAIAGMLTATVTMLLATGVIDEGIAAAFTGLVTAVLGVARQLVTPTRKLDPVTAIVEKIVE